ncbi:MAG: exodeoxyribonuclease III [Candidatus Magnetoovum sp. WYHC-5]|nr:exodeoxyribonuclease III [Candidatus Magnetoovum sp. WYHC-5]
MIKVCSYNVNSIKSRLLLLTDWLHKRNSDIDVLCLQELKVTDDNFPYEEFQQLGYSCEVYGQKTYNGVAICSKLPLSNAWKGFGTIAEHINEQRRIISVSVADKFTLLNVYAPHGDERGNPKYDYKLTWYEHFISYLKDYLEANDKLVILGDFNITRDDLDVYDERALRDTIGTMPEERALIERVLQLGLIDTYRALYPQRRQFTWWSYMGGAVWKDQGMRIDYILVSKSLVSSITEVEVDMWSRKKKTPKPSDHAPIIASLIID